MPFALTLALLQFAVWRLLVARMARRDLELLSSP
jgi:hypothetical protein